MTELETAKQDYIDCMFYAEKWLRKYKETRVELFKIGFEVNMTQALLYVELCGIEPDSRYLEMKEELKKLKQGVEI